jgi:hypothetical protein
MLGLAYPSTMLQVGDEAPDATHLFDCRNQATNQQSKQDNSGITGITEHSDNTIKGMSETLQWLCTF